MGRKTGSKKWAPLQGAGRRSGEGLSTILPYLVGAPSGLPSVLEGPTTIQQPDPGDLYPPALEEIAGPFHGYYFACYTVPEPGGHRAYAKVCTRQPTDVWMDAPAGVKVAGPLCVDESEAVRKVIREARRRLGISSDGSTIIRMIDQLLN
ncbi:hypothetical protein [Ramlibacter tataouinensis]|nr:hypothetical protein [Ramlibacter tataouinensis]